MKIKEGFLIRELSDHYVVVPGEEEKSGFHGMIQMNHTGAFIWRKLEEEKSREELYTSYKEEFQITEEQARKDVDLFVEKLQKEGLLCE